MIKNLYKSILIFVISIQFGFSQTKIISWNLCNFGKSKSNEEIAFIAKTIKEADIVAVQEISESFYGARALAKLSDELNRAGAKWEFVLSQPTNGKGAERYAFLFKSSTVKLVGKPWLEKTLDSSIDREPFLVRFKLKSGEKILLATIHAVPKAKEPWKECKHLYKLDELYKKEDLLVMGDFNLPESNNAFKLLKEKNIKPAFSNIKTSIKMEERAGEKFANEYDNIFIDLSRIKITNSGRIDFTVFFQNLKEARKISDHTPVYADIIF